MNLLDRGTILFILQQFLRMDFLCLCILLIIVKASNFCSQLLDLALELTCTFSNCGLIVAFWDLRQIDLQVAEKNR